ncbi:hypothetical protein ASB7_05590 [Helicobacter ailurogastricus]|nr:hypothetical protein ASB7_05590 [Helicobacter ailurogastricus]
MYRAIQGDLGAVLVGVGNVLGAALVALSWDFYAPLWTSFPKINLLDLKAGGLLQASLLLCLWWMVWAWGKHAPLKASLA